MFDSSTWQATLNKTCPFAPDWDALGRTSFTFAVVSVVAAISAYIRYICYTKLGPLYTFEVSIQPGHKLVTTGPYAYVRHPAYSGGICATIAATVVMMSRDTFIRMCFLTRFIETAEKCSASGALRRTSFHSCIDGLSKLSPGEMIAVGAFGMYALSVANIVRMVSQRLEWEEEMMNEEFKQEWVAYTRAVRWKVIPFIL